MLNDWVGKEERGGREKELFEAYEIMHRWIKIERKSSKIFVSSRITYKVTRGFISNAIFFRYFAKHFQTHCALMLITKPASNRFQFNSPSSFSDIIRANEYTNLIYCVVNSIRF